MELYDKKWIKLRKCLEDSLITRARKNGKPITTAIQKATIIQVLECMDKIEIEEGDKWKIGELKIIK